MAKTLNCKRCEAFLGEIDKGKIHKKSVVLCVECWEKVEIAVQMADLAVSQTKEAFKGKDSEVVDNLMDMFGMKK